MNISSAVIDNTPLGDVVMKTQATTITEPTVGSSSSSFDWSLDDEDDSSQDSSFQQTQPLHDNVAISNDNISQHYEVLPEIIGQGQYGIVRKCVHKASGNTFAVKSIRKYHDQNGAVRREIELLKQVNGHRGIVSLVDVFEDILFFHIVTELFNGGELFDYVVEQIERRENMESPLFDEATVAATIHAILDSVAFLHGRNIVHRDLKPENFLLHNGELKLVDFGLSVTHNAETDEPLSDPVGTPFYMAPEIFLKKQYTNACDMWSVGVMAYVLLVGHPPFAGDNADDIFANIRRGHFSFDDVQISEDAKDFIKGLLKRDHRRRLTAQKALEHPWIVKNLQ